MSAPAFVRTTTALAELIAHWEPFAAPSAAKSHAGSPSPEDLAMRQWLRGICEQAGLDPPEILTLRAYEGVATDVPAMLVQVRELISQERQRVQRLLDQHTGRERSARLLLDQYQRHWIAGVHNLIESYAQKRMAGSSFSVFLDPQKPAPQADTFLAALSLSSLVSRINEHLTDLMADFVAGLSGLATKLELANLPLGENSAKWNSRALPGRLHEALIEKRVFPTKSSRRGGLMGNFTGRKQQVIDERKGQLVKAMRLAIREVESDFAAWCLQFVNTVEISINRQLDLTLEQRCGMNGARLRDRLERLVEAERAVQSAPARQIPDRSSLGDWFLLLSSHHWIPPYCRVP